MDALFAGSYNEPIKMFWSILMIQQWKPINNERNFIVLHLKLKQHVQLIVITPIVSFLASVKYI